MSMSELQNSIKELGLQIRAAAAKLAQSASSDTTPMDDVTKQRDLLRDMNTRMTALQASYDAQYNQEASRVTTQAAGKANGREGLSDLLKSREYARAFAYAVKNGTNPSRHSGVEQAKILYDALTIAGGDPAGEDGGFLVPDDVDTQIREKRRQLHPLADLFTVEPVMANSGWRVMDLAPSTGMTALTSEIPSGSIAQDDQPSFSKVLYSLATYGLIIPVSNELAMDETAGLFSYLANWFAKKQVITENILLKAKLALLSAQNILSTDNPLSKIKAVLNLSLDPAISANASILTNQSGFNYLDQLVDGLGRPILQPDPVTGTPMMFKNKPVIMVSDALLPNRVVTTTGATKGDYYPIYIGDFKQYATLFQRQGLEIKSTDIGGSAWATNSIEVRGITRLGTSVFDTAAAASREIFIPFVG